MASGCMGDRLCRRSRLLQSVITLAAVFGLLLSVVGCTEVGPKPGPTSDRLASSAGASLAIDFAQETGIPSSGFTTVERGRNVFPFIVRDGQLTHGMSVGKNAASYLLTDLTPEHVTRIGATVNLSSDADGTFALLVGDGPVPADETEPAPNAAVHFVADSTGWSFAIWEAGGSGQTVLDRGVYGGSFNRDDASFEVSLNGDTATVYLPDSTSTSVTDPRIQKFGGPWAVWELFESSAGMLPLGFRKIWAAG